MSRSQAIAAVTAVLAHRIGVSTKLADVAADVEIGRPKAPDANGGALRKVNIYLYQVTPNAAWRNADLPTRGSDGNTIRNRPQVALDLHYLLSFYGDDTLLQPQLMLGAVVSDLHAAPLFVPKIIEEAHANANKPAHQQAIKDSELGKSLELVRFTPASLSLDELSKIWSIFFQTPHALSVAYQAAVVLIEKDVAIETALPVRERDVHGLPLVRPIIESIVAQKDASNPEQIIKTEAIILIQGKNLTADQTTVLIDGIKVKTQTESDSEISLIIPELMEEEGTKTPLRAGSHTLQIVHGLLLGGLASPEPHQIIESSPVPFLLHPTIQVEKVGRKVKTAEGPVTLFSTTVTVVFKPKVAKAERVWILLSGVPAAGESPRAYRFIAPRDNGVVAPDEDTSKITFAVKDVLAGQYLIQAHVDGGDSPPVELGTFK
jgi:hypothetical protein